MPKRDGRRSCGSQCCGGCLGIILLAVVAFTIWYSSTGTYQPRIPPPAPLPNPNAFNDYVAVGQLFKANGGSGAVFAGPGNPSLAAEQTLVGRNQAVLARLRAAMANPCQVPSTRDANAMYPYLADTREVARLLRAEEDVLAVHDDYAGSFSAGIDGIHFAQDITRGGTMIHGLVSIAIHAIVEQPMIANVDKLNASECAALAKRLEATLRVRVAMAAVLREEQYTTLASLSRMSPRAAADYFIPTDSEPSPIVRQFVGVAWHLNRDKTLREFESLYAMQQREAVKPTAHRSPIPEPSTALARIIFPVFEQGQLKFDENDAHNRLLLCMLKIREYQLTNHRLPARLDQLGIDSSLLIDPYSGGQITYRPKGNDYLLYCFGPDGKDDGGIPVDQASSGAAKGDIGVRPFRSWTPQSGSQPSRFYRRVPHMLPPKLPPGSPPLQP